MFNFINLSRGLQSSEKGPGFFTPSNHDFTKLL
jgi:hypothetical protein